MSTPIVSDTASLREALQPWQREGDAYGLEQARGTVLVVEDDPEQRELLVELVSEWGYAPLPAASAEEAERAVSHRHVEAAVVDIFLPGRSGTHLLARLRERFPHAVLVGISALGDASLSRRCKGQGADRFLDKPVTPEDLAQALKAPRTSWH